MIVTYNLSIRSQIILNNMKYLISILGIISIGLFASCGGEKADCCGECGGDANGSAEGNASE